MAEDSVDGPDPAEADPAEAARLRAALAGSYDIDGALGAGGMATVYRATDLKHRRMVAIKVLREELSRTIGRQRFLREIEILAGLQHPHILPLFDSGDANGLLYFVMPLIDGESLGDRLKREKQLPVDEAVKMAREIAAALSYAHARGIVHRDIKPDNILLTGGEAVVADFGVARALDVAGRSGRLTATGLALGTPLYISPEQVSGEGEADARSDIYSLGCLLYEMIAGRPPFAGPSIERLLMQHMAAPVPRITATVPTAGPLVEQAIERAMAKSPAERFQTSAEFAGALANALVHPTAEYRSVARSVPRWRRHWRAAIGAATLATALGVALGVSLRRGRGDVATDPTSIAVMPFSVQGDSSLAFLREGMVDLVTTQLSIESDANPLDARTVISEWHRTVGVGEDASTAQARRLAARLGSGRLVLGSIVGTSADLTIGASIRDVDGSHRVEASVHGSLDSLSVMVLRLTSQLLARSAGEPARRLAELTGTAVPALRAYLEGRAAYRHGELGKAIERFTDALQQDSTFALAALGMAASGAWSQQSGQSTALRRGLRTGYALRDRLPERDRLLFEGYVLPQTAAPHTAAQQLGAWQRAVDGAPELAEAQYEYGDRLYHSGAQLGIADASERARLAFARALALDSTFAAPLAHLVEIAASAGDVDQTRRLYALYRGDAATADARDFVRWRVAYALRDDRTKAALWSQPEGIGLTALNRIIGFGQMEFAALDDVDRAANELRRRADTRSANTANVLPGQTLHAWALNRGRRTAAVQAVELLASETANTLASSLVYFDVDQVPVLDAMFWDGDSARASAAIGRLERSIAQRPPSDGGALARHYSNLCVTGLWHMSLGHVDAARPALVGLRRGLALRDSAVVHGVDPALCSVMIDAMSPQPTISGAALARLDSVLVTGPYVFGGAFGNLVLARLLNARGEHVAALRAVRRRPYDWDTGPLYLTSYLREEGHLGTITGDTAAARRAWDRYLALRQGAEPAYLASTDAVRRARVLLH